MPVQENLFDGVLPVECCSDSEPKATTNKGGKSGLKRRKKANRTVEDYYAVLEVSPDAATPELKRGYLQKIRQYPPESYPVEFEQIRRAYDTLRDAEQRKEYDILRQYGESIEDLLREACGGRGITARAVKLLERAITIDPTHIRAGLSLAFAYIFRGQEAAFQRQFFELKRQAPPEKQLFIFDSKITQLIQVGRIQTAFDELQELTKTQPDAIKKNWSVYVKVYEALGLEGQLLAEIEAQISDGAIPQSADAELYVVLLHIATGMEDEGKTAARVQNSAKKWLKKFYNTPELPLIADVFFKEYQKCREYNDYYGAIAFIELALVADRKNPKWQQYSLELQTVVQILREVDRIFEDDRLYPPIVINVVRWVNEEFHVLESECAEMTEWLPLGFDEDMSGMDEIYAAGIIVLKKRYPAIYRQYQQRWETLFKEKTAGLNREERRGLRL